MRVLIVAPSLEILGGQAVQASRLITFMEKEAAVEVKFLPVNPRLPGPLAKLQSIKYVRTVLTSLVYFLSLLWRVRKYDVIHIFSASYSSFLLAPMPAILVSRLYGKKTILNYRSGEAEDHLRRSSTAVRIIKLVDAIIVPSQYLVDVFAKFGLRARWIFNFVQLDRFCWRERKPLRPVFFSNRNFEPHYNVACVLRAFSIIQQRFPDAALIVAGDGKQRTELEKLAAQLALRNVTFLGLVSQDRMPELYDAADIYLNCSDIDNMPGSIIEAYASGLAVVSTKAGGIPYIVTNNETGLLVSCGDYEGIAAAAIRLLEFPELAQTLINAARAECQKYRWEAVRSEWLNAYAELGGGTITLTRAV